MNKLFLNADKIGRNLLKNIVQVVVIFDSGQRPVNRCGVVGDYAERKKIFCLCEQHFPLFLQPKKQEFLLYS